jgi:TolA-binding protein
MKRIWQSTFLALSVTAGLKAALAPQIVTSIPGALDSGQPNGSRGQAMEPLQKPQPAILIAPQQPASGSTMRTALPDTQQLYSDLKQELQNIIVRVAALEKQVESLMRTIGNQQPQQRIAPPSTKKWPEGALLTQHVPK